MLKIIVIATCDFCGKRIAESFTHTVIQDLYARLPAGWTRLHIDSREDPSVDDTLICPVCTKKEKLNGIHQ